MQGIFISYRRQDSQSAAGRLGDELKKSLPEALIFRDVETIEPGVDFVDAINRALNACSVLLAVIGPRWINLADKDGKRRLDDPNDFTRIEVSTALKREGVRVIPVLVEGAIMPSSDELPDDLKPLARRNAIELTDKRWKYDVGELETTLRQIIGLQAAELKAQPSKTMNLPWKWLAGAAGLLALVLGIYFSGRGPGPQPQTVVVPNVVGMPVDEARRVLDEIHLTGQPEELRSDAMPPNHVLSTRPAAQRPVSANSRVILYVAQPTIRMPRLVGRPLGEAQAMLKEMRLSLAEPEFRQTGSAAPNTVLEQSPAAEATAEPGQEVKLVVAQRIESVMVPNISTLDFKHAVEILVGIGLKPGNPIFVPRERPDDIVNQVRKQSIAEGQSVKPGTRIDLWVWGPNVLLPNVIGTEARRAAQRLEQMGLRSEFKTVEIDTVKVGVVVGQAPESDAEIDGSTTVVLTVAKARPQGSTAPLIMLNPKVIEVLKNSKVLIKPPTKLTH